MKSLYVCVQLHRPALTDYIHLTLIVTIQPPLQTKCVASAPRSTLEYIWGRGSHRLWDHVQVSLGMEIQNPSARSMIQVLDSKRGVKQACLIDLENLEKAQPRRSSLLLTPTASSWVPKTTLCSNNLEEFKELTENCYTHGYGITEKEYILKAAKGRGAWVRAQGGSKPKIFSCLLPGESWAAFTTLNTDM